MRGVAWAWAWLAVVPAAAQQSSDLSVSQPPPPLAISVDDDAARLSLRPRFGNDRWEFAPILKAGSLAPFGGGGTYPTLLPSPFALIGVRAGVTGPVDALVVVTHGLTTLSSQRPFGPGSASAASPANDRAAVDRLQHPLGVTSLHADVGKRFSLGDAWRAAAFAAFDSWLARPSRGDYDGANLQGDLTGSTGVIATRQSGSHALTLSAALEGRRADPTMWRNGEATLVPGGRAGIEYSVGPAAIGAEATASRADKALRPYLSVRDSRVALTLAGDLRKSENAFVPDRRVVGAEVGYRLTDSISLQLSGHAGEERYPMAPEPTKVYRAVFGLAVDIGAKVQARVAKAVETDGALRRFRAENAVATNDRLPGAANAADFHRALAAAPTFDDFVARYDAKSTDRILASVSEVTRSIASWNYNYAESREHPNVNDAREFYARVRTSALTRSQDPITVCIGSAQFGALMAEELGRRNGVPIQAMAVSVRVPDGDRRSSGHAVSAIKTREYGIVFVDWGQLTPTHTWDTREALRIYQALQGMPAIYHELTGGPNGEPVGKLFTEEGKLILRELTAYGETDPTALERIFREEPSSAPRALERYRQLLRRR
ncbi:MAG: hypothetical protein HY553_15715 [Elusimicrobia bacterium]|nr:hypothetical protein [Elusimicrobiota bacterium]